MQNEMSRGPLAEDEHSRKGMEGRAAFGRPPLHSFSAVVILCLPLAFHFAFKEKQKVLEGEDFNFFRKFLEPLFVQTLLARLDRLRPSTSAANKVHIGIMGPGIMGSKYKGFGEIWGGPGDTLDFNGF